MPVTLHFTKPCAALRARPSDILVYAGICKTLCAVFFKDHGLPCRHGEVFLPPACCYFIFTIPVFSIIVSDMYLDRCSTASFLDVGMRVPIMLMPIPDGLQLTYKSE